MRAGIQLGQNINVATLLVNTGQWDGGKSSRTSKCGK